VLYNFPHILLFYVIKWTLEQVDVGDFLRLKSCVLYTEVHDPDQPLINVEVVAHVTRPELRSSEVSLYKNELYKIHNHYQLHFFFLQLRSYQRL